MNHGGATAVEAVVFDLGGVLIDWNPRHLYRDVFSGGEEMEYFLGSVCTLEWHSQHDLGRPMSVTLPEQADRFPQYRAQIMQWANQEAMVDSTPPRPCSSTIPRATAPPRPSSDSARTSSPLQVTSWSS